jgi:DNA-binding cell septation regulator SpoVG
MDENEVKKEPEKNRYEKAELSRIEAMVKEGRNLEDVAKTILEDTYKGVDILNKDSLDRFLDMVLLKVRTGNYYIPSLAFPARRMSDKEFEQRIIELINEHLNPEIVLPVLKYFARNVKDSDKNLYLAYLITSDDIIKSIFDTFLMFKNDIFVKDPDQRTLNVKKIQQLPPATDNSIASPLDAAARFKYILEFIASKQKVDHIYTQEQLKLSSQS